MNVLCSSAVEIGKNRCTFKTLQSMNGLCSILFVPKIMPLGILPNKKETKNRNDTSRIQQLKLPLPKYQLSETTIIFVRTENERESRIVLFGVAARRKNQRVFVTSFQEITWRGVIISFGLKPNQSGEGRIETSHHQ